MSFNSKEYWKKELGGDAEWKKHAKESESLKKSIDRTKTIILPEVLKRKISKGGAFLDAGCGSGYAAETFFDSSAWDKGYGVDFQQHRIDFCNENRKKDGLEFIVSDLQNIPIQDKSVNMIYTGAVLLHIPLEDKIRTIQEFKRILTDDGFYFGHEVVLSGPQRVVWNNNHITNVNLEWLKEQFDPFEVDVLEFKYDTYTFQIIYAHK